MEAIAKINLILLAGMFGIVGAVFLFAGILIGRLKSCPYYDLCHNKPDRTGSGDCDQANPLKAARIRAGLSIEAAAYKLSISSRTLDRYESPRRKHPVPEDIIFEMARIYNDSALVLQCFFLSRTGKFFREILGGDFNPRDLEAYLPRRRISCKSNMY